MTSIRERAAALNLADKFCARPQATGVAIKEIQSSFIWSSIISHLRSTVTVKRRRIHFKSHSGCFLGSEAVDVLAEYIPHVKGLEGANMSRGKVVCVCQALLESEVFESVGTKVSGKDKKQEVFHDSKNALYRFAGTSTPSVEELESGVLVNGIQKLFCGSSPDSQDEQTYPFGSHTEISAPVRSTQTSIKASQPDTHAIASLSLALPETDPSLSPSRVKMDSGLPRSLVDEVWQEQTLLRLLSVVELPILEGVLQSTSSQSPSKPLAHSNPDLIYSSSHLDRQILEAFKCSQQDEWLCTALDCLDFLPDQRVVELSRELPRGFLQDQEGCNQESPGGSIHRGGHHSDEQTNLSPSTLAQCKLLLYETLAKHYSNINRPPLLPQHLNDVYGAITDLLVNAKFEQALEALQLCLKLLSPSCREELRRLLSFMSLAADPLEIKVDKEMENRLAVKKSFARAILHNKGFSKEKEDLMVIFMLSNAREIFKIPGALHKIVSDKLASLEEEKELDVTGSTVSLQVPSSSFADTTKMNTKLELWKLLDNIHLDTKMPSKKKKHLFKQFYQAHPEIFNQYFGPSAGNML
ncbi:DEP domain-containing protein 7-like [Pholidichthys leucotaenia]